jgi:hypothetical protein
MEPERKIEKLLQAVAKKRREQAGDAMELPAAVRERLRREISRREQGKSGGGFFASWFGAFRPRLAFAVCFIAATAVGAWLLLPSLTRPKPASLASANLRLAKVPPVEQPAPLAAPPPVAPSEVARDIKEKPMTFGGDFATEQAPATATAGKPGAIVALNDKSAPAGVLENRVEQTNLLAGINGASDVPLNQGVLAEKASEAPADLFANAGTLNKDSMDREPLSAAPQISTNTTMGILTLAAAEPETQKKLKVEATPAAAPVVGVVFDGVIKQETGKADTLASQRFYRTDILARRSAKEPADKPSPVLASFRVEQNAGEMRVVDADGSVYTGTVQVTNEDAGARTAFASAFKNAPAVSTTRTLQQMPAAQNYFFRVTGTNRNLRQNVVFSGNLIPLTNALVTRSNANAAGGGGGGGGGAMPSVISPSLLLNSRISGTAIIGNQKGIEVNATPAR